MASLDILKKRMEHMIFGAKQETGFHDSDKTKTDYQFKFRA